jgi:hypothetical protein
MSVTSDPVRLKQIAAWLRAGQDKAGLDALPLHQLERAREINRRLGERLRAGRRIRGETAAPGVPS